jgi:DNA/RNA endonuclease YhcR with UshA esterase domain
MSRRGWVLLLPDNGRMAPVVKGSLGEVRALAEEFRGAAEVKSIQWVRKREVRA